MPDSNEGVQNFYLYRAFGEQTDVIEEGISNRFTWVGRLGYYREPDVDTYWLRARVYDPQRGRFFSRDPVREVNLYRCPGNSPGGMVDPSGMQGCGSPGCRGEAVQGPATTGPRRHGRGRYHRPSPPQPPEPMGAQEMDAEEPAGGLGAVSAEEGGPKCGLQPPWATKNKKLYGGGWRWVCGCEDQADWCCSLPTGWGPPKGGHTKGGNRFIKELWASACSCDCHKAGERDCRGTVNFRRREWRGDSALLLKDTQKEKHVRGKCVPCEGWTPSGPEEEECELTWSMDTEASNTGVLVLSKGNLSVSYSGWSGYPSCGPESQCISCLGPVPAGEHTVGKWYARKSGTRAMRISGTFCAGRGAFLVHGGRSTSSRGCIVISDIGGLERQMGTSGYSCEYPVRLTVSYAIASAGDCPRSTIPTTTVSRDCIKVNKGPHTCQVGCAPNVLGPPSVPDLSLLPVTVSAGNATSYCEGCGP